jgi:hypothetical protein
MAETCKGKTFTSIELDNLMDFATYACIYVLICVMVEYISYKDTGDFH